MSDTAEDNPNVRVVTKTTDNQGRRVVHHHEVGPGRDDHIATDHVEQNMTDTMARERERSRRSRNS